MGIDWILTRSIDMGRYRHFHSIGHGTFFFAYNNPSVRNEKGGRSSALSRHSDRVEVNRYLARAVSWFVLLDHSIVAQWRALRRVSTKSVMGHLGTKTVGG